MATRMLLGLDHQEEMLADLQEAHSTLQRAVKMLHRSAPTPVTTVAQLHSFPPAHRQVNNTFSALRNKDKDVAAAAAGSTQTMTRAASAPPGARGPCVEGAWRPSAMGQARTGPSDQADLRRHRQSSEAGGLNRSP